MNKKITIENKIKEKSLKSYISKRTQRNLRFLFIVAATGLLMGLGMSIVRYFLLGRAVDLAISMQKGGLLGVLLSLSLYSLEYILFGPRVRRYSLLTTLGLKTVLYAAVVTVIYIGISAMYTAEMSWEVQLPFLAPAYGFSMGAAFVASAVFMVRDILGKGVFTKIVSGRYHHPFEEKLVFLFLDLVGSTTIAERIGHLKFHSFLNDFFYDIDEAITGNGGEIYKYVGDEIIVVWRQKPGRSRCLYAWTELCEILKRRAEIYRKRYGLVPEFRIGIHAGPAVAGELGDSKKEIAYLGDTVNTASRILSACKDFNRYLLLSADALKAVETPSAWSAVQVGRVTLRGKKRAVELFGLDPS